MDDLTIERRGGFAGLPARAKLSMDSLAPTDKAAIEALFNAKVRLPPAQGADRFTYKLTRTGPQGVQSIEAPEHLVPPGVAAQVKDELP